jgi:beta-xylosidase
VWAGYCADPFVLRTGSGYVMYGTSPRISAAGRVFQMLYSEDLTSWEQRDGALQLAAPPPPNQAYWAPEVAHSDGRYWMYYSTGVAAGSTDDGHHLRVATAASPTGPFTDLGVNLTPGLRFAIDPSPFQDAAGGWWLYFATDVLDGPRPGTAIAVQPLREMTALAGEPAIVLRPRADWQRYAPDRAVYGGVYDWHTIEGPSVVHRDGRYWMFHSGGNWRFPGYGVTVAVADRPDGPWRPRGDGPSVLSTAATGLRGPGHNSVVTDPTGTDHLVFHAFDPTRYARQPYVLPLAWTARGPELLVDAADTSGGPVG